MNWDEEEAFSKRIVHTEEYDWSGGCYEWSTAQICTLDDGTYWIRSGSGCSCNGIWEEDWTPLRDMNQVHSHLDSLNFETEDLPRKAAMIKYAQGLLS